MAFHATKSIVNTPQKPTTAGKAFADAKTFAVMYIASTAIMINFMSIVKLLT